VRLVQRRAAGGVNWSVLVALASMVAALAAVAGVVVVSRQVQEGAQRARLSTALDSLWRLQAEWNSSDMEDARSGAAAALLSDEPSTDIDAVLDFFDWLALLLERGALDEEMVWHEFYWPMANYWFASQDYVQQIQRDDPTAWQDLGTVMTRLVAVEARRKRRTAAEAVPSEGQMRDFLSDEAGDAECAEGHEGERTPL
jgi:hypothetical protein